MAQVTTTKSETTAGSDTVVATVAESQLQQMNHPDSVQTSSSLDASRAFVTETASGRSLGTQSTTSAMPAGTDLNAPALLATPSGLRIKSMSEINSRMIKRLRQEIPTADLVTSGSYKINSKLLIKIVPSPKATALGKYVPQLTFDAFSLQSVAESDAERYQLHETFENFVLFLFGRRPRIWTMQGIVANGRRAPDATGEESDDEEQRRLSLDMDWANTLLQDWEDFYRGSKSVEMGAQTYLAYEDSVVEATLLELTMVRNAQLPSAVNSTLTFVVHDRTFIGQEYRDGFTAPNLAQLIEDTNNNKFFGDKVAPAQIMPAPITAEEVDRQRDIVETKHQIAQDELGYATAEREALEKSKREDEETVAAAEQAIENFSGVLARAEERYRRWNHRARLTRPRSIPRGGPSRRRKVRSGWPKTQSTTPIPDRGRTGLGRRRWRRTWIRRRRRTRTCLRSPTSTRRQRTHCPRHRPQTPSPETGLSTA